METQNTVREEAGDFRAIPLSWTFEQKTPEEQERSGSKSGCIVIQFGILNQWYADDSDEGGVWSVDWPEGWVSYARVYIIKRDGSLNDTAVANLIKCGIWDGDFNKLAEDPPHVPCLIEIQSSEYNGKTSFRTEWINPDAPAPTKRSGGLKPANPDVLAGLAARFGGSTRALKGAAQKPTGNAPAAPGGAPAAPVAAPAPNPETAAGTQLYDSEGNPVTPPF